MSLAYAVVHSNKIKNKDSPDVKPMRKKSWWWCFVILLLNTVILSYALVMAFRIRDWAIDESGLLEDGESEREMSYGQVVPIALAIIVPLYASAQACSGKLRGYPFVPLFPLGLPFSRVSIEANARPLS